MSLYVGHLSPRIRPGDLERVFRRFGRCNLQLKDGYGFVVYHIIADAERALRELRGKDICGEPVSLNWSNKQPTPLRRSTRPTRTSEPYHGRNFLEDENGVGMRVRGSQDRRDFSVGNHRIPASDLGRRRNDVLDKETVHIDEDIGGDSPCKKNGGDRGVSLKEVTPDEGNVSEHNPEENDRWGEPLNNVLPDHGAENDTEFDRYEPYHGCSRRDEKENYQITTSYTSMDPGSSHGKRRREHSDNELEKTVDKSKRQLTCYNCGLLGHIMRTCPKGDTRREKFAKFSSRKDELNFTDRGDRRFKTRRTNSWVRLNSRRDPLISRHYAGHRKESQSCKTPSVRKSESFPEREKRRSNLREESKAKKRSKKERRTQKKELKKRRARKFETSSLSSGSPSSDSRSLFSKSDSTTSSHSGSRSASSSSRSASVSSYSKSKSPRLRPRSRSRSRSGALKSPSLSVSLDENPPSPKAAQVNVSVGSSPERDFENIRSPNLKLSSPVIVGNLDNLKSPNFKHSSPVNVGNSNPRDKYLLATSKIDDGTNGKHSGSYGDNSLHSALDIGYKETDASSNLLKDIAAAYENCGEQSKLQGALSINPNMQIPLRCEGGNSARITTHEMLLALEHYGLPTPREGMTDISVEEYFGAARLWPWEMIYYRQKKKGPISTENYARRLEQNKEFNIVDKYIRSSSGWTECTHNDV